MKKTKKDDARKRLESLAKLANVGVTELLHEDSMALMTSGATSLMLFSQMLLRSEDVSLKKHASKVLYSASAMLAVAASEAERRTSAREHP